MMRRRFVRGTLVAAMAVVAVSLAAHVSSASTADEQCQVTTAMLEAASTVAAAVAEAAPAPGEWVGISSLQPAAVEALYAATADLCALAGTSFDPADLEGANLAVVFFPSEARWQLFVVDATGTKSFDWSYQY